LTIRATGTGCTGNLEIKLIWKPNEKSSIDRLPLK